MSNLSKTQIEQLAEEILAAVKPDTRIAVSQEFAWGKEKIIAAMVEMYEKGVGDLGAIPGATIPEKEEDVKGAWDMALTLANNLCVQISDCYNNDDQITEADTANECAKKIRAYIGDYIPELFSERKGNDVASPGAKPTVPCDAPLYEGKAMEQEAALKEQLRLCLDMILKGSYETFEKILRDEVVSVSRIKEAFSAYFDVKETPTNF